MWMTQAKYESEYKILCTFEDGKQVLADFRSFLNNTSLRQLKQYLNMDLFRKFRVQDGSLCWEGNVFDVYGEDIYNGDFTVA